MKNIQKNIFFLFFILIFSLPVFAQEIVKEPEFPNGYEQWPNVLTREKQVNSSTISASFYAKRLKGSQWTESLMVARINGEIIFSSFNKALLGNFSHIFYNFRPVNIFTGKGLLKKQKKRLRLKEYVKKI